MNVHHNTVKKFAKIGVEISQDDDGEFTAVYKDRELVSRETRSLYNFMALVVKLRGEYPSILIEYEDGELRADVDGETLWSSTDDFIDADQAFADILDAYSSLDMGGDDSGDDETPKESVVPTKYRTEYARRGNANHCGDELAIWMNDRFTHVVDGVIKFDVDAFEKFLRVNGVPLSGKWFQLRYSGQKGWQGRFRMNARLVLEKIIAHRGELYDGSGNRINLSPETMAALVAKHPIKVKKNKG